MIALLLAVGYADEGASGPASGAARGFGARPATLVVTEQATLRQVNDVVEAVGARQRIAHHHHQGHRRHALGIVVFSGVTLATLLTLVVVPSFYALLARRTGSPQAVAKTLERLMAGLARR